MPLSLAASFVYPGLGVYSATSLVSCLVFSGYYIYVSVWLCICYESAPIFRSNVGRGCFGVVRLATRRTTRLRRRRRMRRRMRRLWRLRTWRCRQHLVQCFQKHDVHRINIPLVPIFQQFIQHLFPRLVDEPRECSDRYLEHLLLEFSRHVCYRLVICDIFVTYFLQTILGQCVSFINEIGH